jgi:tetratricopeptide (TPR) repeat protein
MLQATVQARPDNADVRHNLALALLWAGRLGESVDAAREAMTIDAEHTQTRFLLRDAGRALWRQERFEEAIEAFRAAAEGSSERPALSRELAWALATCPREELRDGREALVIARRLCELTRFSSPQELDVLAAAQAETGDFEGAVESARRAVTLAEQSLQGSPGAAAGDRGRRVEAILRQLRARLALYESGRPYHHR